MAGPCAPAAAAAAGNPAQLFSCCGRLTRLFCPLPTTTGAWRGVHPFMTLLQDANAAPSLSAWPLRPRRLHAHCTLRRDATMMPPFMASTTPSQRFMRVLPRGVSAAGGRLVRVLLSQPLPSFVRVCGGRDTSAHVGDERPLPRLTEAAAAPTWKGVSSSKACAAAPAKRRSSAVPGVGTGCEPRGARASPRRRRAQHPGAAALSLAANASVRCCCPAAAPLGCCACAEGAL